jgi:hypothetical protein
MQVVRRYTVKVYTIGQGADGKPYGDTYSAPGTVDTGGIMEAVGMCLASVTEGESVHSVQVLPVAEFLP